MRTVLLLFLLLLGGCASGVPTRATPQAAPTIPAVAELLTEAAGGAIRTVGYLYMRPEETILVDSLSIGADGSAAPTEARALWLGSAFTPPADIPVAEAGAARYALVEARGTLEGPAQFGPDGRYAYQLVAPMLTPLSVRELTMPLLLQNSGLYEGQPVRLQAALLASSDSAILVEKLGAGGVPEASALQVKLAASPRDPALATRLQSAGSGDVYFGPVEITGLWRNGRLYPLLVVPR